MNTAKKFTGLDIATVGFIVAFFAQPAQAGWSGAMNGIGYGATTVNVRAYDTLASKTRYVSTTNMVSPSAAITITSGYVFGALLPQDASSATVAKVKGLPGYIWEATTVGSDGDSTDNIELENRIRITAADCASLDMDSSASVNESNKSGIITVNVKGTAGTAFWTRGIEYTGPPGLLPNDDPGTTNVNETLEFLKTNVNSSLRWDILMVGPLDLNTTNCNPLTIPFTFETDITNLYFFTDGVAKSLPLVIECPSDIVVDCQQPVKYPETVLVGGCGNIAVSFDPPAPSSDGSFPVGAFPVGTNLVTVTATDKDTNTTSCTFNVVVTDTNAPVPDIASLPDVTGQCSATISGPPTATDECSGTIITGTTTDSLTRTTQGTSIVTWSFDDGHGNISTQTQRIVVDDDVSPVKPTLEDVISEGCASASVTPPTPTTTDNCAGTVQGTTSTSFPITALGTTVVTWTFNDGNGNSTTVTQNVTVSGLTFKGFYAPIGTVSNTCSQPSVVVVNRGSVAPLKFDMFCGASRITTGTPPTLDIQPVLSDCSLTGTNTTVVAEYQNDWHYNWDTTGWAKATYKVTVNLPGGSAKPYVFIKIK